MEVFYGDHNLLPQVVSAKSAKGLHRKIKKLQFRKGVQYRFINFYFDGSEHVAWYYTLLDENETIREELNGITKK